MFPDMPGREQRCGISPGGPLSCAADHHNDALCDTTSHLDRHPQRQPGDRDTAGADPNTGVEFPSCPDCAGPLMLLGKDTRYVHCLTTDCPAEAIRVGEVCLEHRQSPRGLPRPVLGRRPVPWVAPIIGDRVAWTSLNDNRIQEAERLWLCQVCGDPLSVAPTAWVATCGGDVADGGALHRGCLDLARRLCPVLRVDDSFVFAEVRRDDQAADWASVCQRLVDYENEHGQLPVLMAYPSR